MNWFENMVQIYNQSRHGRRFLFNIGETIDRGAECAEVERRRRVNRGAVNAEGVMCGEGNTLLANGYGVKKISGTIYMRMPKCWQIDLNCKNHTECIKTHHFEIRNRKIFWGWGTAPSQTHFPVGRGNPIPTPHPTRRLRRLDQWSPNVE